MAGAPAERMMAAPLVVKIGSSSLVDARGRLRRRRLETLAAEVGAARSAGVPVCVVSSGAIALGLGSLGRSARPGRVAELQAAAAVGQGLLQRAWGAALGRHGARSAQVLLTAAEIRHRAAYLNARATLGTLLAWGLTPVVNENDSTATDEITFGDNDALAAQVAVLLGARLLLLLTDQDGLYTRDPRLPGAELIEEVSDHRLLESLDVSAAGSTWGSGGMRSKVVAAEMAGAGGVPTVIAGSARPGVIGDVLAGGRVGTRFRADRRAVSSFKLWLRYGKPAQGRLLVDPGARRALAVDGASLLPVGVTAVEGSFAAGDGVDIATAEGPPFAKGIAELSATELRRLIGRRGGEPAVHRDYLVLLDAR